MSETAVLLCDKVYKEAEITTSVRPEVDRRPVGHTFSPLLLEQKMEQRKASLIMGRSSSHLDDVVVLWQGIRQGSNNWDLWLRRTLNIRGLLAELFFECLC